MGYGDRGDGQGTFGSELSPGGRSSTDTDRSDGTVWGLHLRWGAILGGTLLMIGVSWLVFLLGAGLTFLIGRPDTIKGVGLALPILLVLSTLVGAAAGGLFSGWVSRARGEALPRASQADDRRRGGLHGLASWSVAFVATCLLALSMFGSVAHGVGAGLLTAGSTAVNATAATGGDVSGTSRNLLQSLGYSRSQADARVTGGQQELRDSASNDRLRRENLEADAYQAADDTMKVLGSTILAFWASWLLSLALAVLLGAYGAEEGFHAWVLRHTYPRHHEQGHHAGHPESRKDVVTVRTPSSTAELDRHPANPMAPTPSY